MKVFSKQDIEKMLEEEFVREIIVPILEGHGWKEVQNWHGRQELGKDIVGWRANPEVGYLETLAVVAKAAAPSGAHGAAVISTQITQALKRPFRTPTTQRELDVDQVWVAVNKPLAKETKDSIEAGITLPRGKLVILDIDYWWRLAQPFILTSKRDILQLSQDTLKDFESPYDLRLITTDHGQSLEVHERYPGQSEELPLQGRVVFTFEDETKHQELTEYLRRIEETGEGEALPDGIRARIETEGIDEVALQLFGGIPDDMSFFMSSAEHREKIRLSFRVEPLDGPAVELPFIEMDVLARGTKQMRMANEHQDLPIRVELIVVFEGEMTFNLAVKVGQASAQWIDKGMKLLDAITRRGTVTVTNVDTGITMHQMCIVSPQAKSRLSPAFAELARVLAAVEARTRKVVIIPDTPVVQADAQILDELRLIVDQGYIDFTAETFQMEFLVNSNVLDDLLVETKGHASEGHFRARKDEIVEIFGTQLSLGRSDTKLPASTLTNETEIRSRAEEADSDEDQAIIFEFETNGGGKVRREYIDWQDGRVFDQ
jgi:hypothetical protein